MEKLFVFIANNVFLVGCFIAVLCLTIYMESRRGSRSISPQVAMRILNRDEAVLVDLRASGDYRSGHIKGAINIPYVDLSKQLSELDQYKEKPVIFVCAQGQHSGAAGKQLKKAGFGELYHIAQGINGWQMHNLPLVKGR